MFLCVPKKVVATTWPHKFCNVLWLKNFWVQTKQDANFRDERAMAGGHISNATICEGVGFKKMPSSMKSLPQAEQWRHHPKMKRGHRSWPGSSWSDGLRPNSQSIFYRWDKVMILLDQDWVPDGVLLQQASMCSKSHGTGLQPGGQRLYSCYSFTCLFVHSLGTP